MSEIISDRPSPFERLAQRFDKIPADEDLRYRDIRRLIISDGTEVSIMSKRLSEGFKPSAVKLVYKV